MSSDPNALARQQGLAVAVQVVQQTRNLLPNGSANVRDLQVDTQDHADFMLRRVRDQQILSDGGPLTAILNRAKLAVAGKTGNCGEMAAVAFAIMYMRGIFPIKYVRYNRGDHAFVVIGPSGMQFVCDPWAEDAYPASAHPTRVHQLYRGNPPGFDDLEVVHECLTGGSEAQFNFLTASQHADDLMDISK